MVLVAAAVLVVSVASASIASAKFTTAIKPNKITGNVVAGEEGIQKFTTNAGVVECTGAATSGTAEALESGEQHVTVHYTGCKAFGLLEAHITDATYLFTTNLSTPTANTVHILNTITITVTPSLFTAHCAMTVSPQTSGTIHFINEAGGSVKVVPTVEGIHYVGNGGPCGKEAATNGKYHGASTIMGENGAISVDD